MKNKEAYINTLINNPKYDSEWIEAASTLLSIENNNFCIGELEDLNSEQITVITEALKFNNENDTEINISVLTNHGKFDLNSTQMRIISAGYRAGVSDELMIKIANPEIPYVISNYIVQGLVEGFDMIPYLNGYDKDQVIEIFSAFKDGIDFHDFAKQTISAKEMYVIRCAINVGMNAYFNEDNELIIKKENHQVKL